MAALSSGKTQEATFPKRIASKGLTNLTKPFGQSRRGDELTIPSMTLDTVSWGSTVDRPVYSHGESTGIISRWRMSRHDHKKECAIKVFKSSSNQSKDCVKYMEHEFRFQKRYTAKADLSRTVGMWTKKEIHNLRRMNEAGILCPSVSVPASRSLRLVPLPHPLLSMQMQDHRRQPRSPSRGKLKPRNSSSGTAPTSLPSRFFPRFNETTINAALLRSFFFIYGDSRQTRIS